MNRKLVMVIGVAALLLVLGSSGSWNGQAAPVAADAAPAGRSGAPSQPASAYQASATPGPARMWLPIVFRQWSVLFLPTPTPTRTRTATPTPTRIFTPVTGPWAGTTNRGHPVTFNINNSAQVSGFTLQTDFTAPSCGVTSDVLTITAPNVCDIVKNRFTLASAGFSASGTLTSSSRMTGTYDFTNFQVVVGIPSPPYTCTFAFTQSGTWSARPAPTPTPTPTPAPFTNIVTENFEGAFPGAWQVRDLNADGGEYYWGKRTCRPYPGGLNSGWAVGGGTDGATLPCGSNYPNAVSSWMIFGPFSLADATSAELTFRLWLNAQPGSDWFYWVASTDGIHFQGNSASDSSNGWVSRRLDLSSVPGLGSLLGRTQVWIALVFESDQIGSYPEGAYVDNIVLRKCTASRCVDAPGAAVYAEEGTLNVIPASISLEP